MALDDIEITARLRDEVSREAERAEQSLQEMDAAAADLAAGLSDADREARALSRQMARTGTTTAAAAAQVDRLAREATQAARRMAALRRETRQLEQEQEDAARASSRQAKAINALQRASERGSAAAGKLGSTLMKAFKAPAIIAGITLIAGAISALGAAAVAAVGALGPIVGVAAALPALGIAVKSSTALIKAAVGPSQEAAEAIKEYGANSKEAAEAMKDLNPRARAFAKTLAEAGKAQDGLRETAQNAALPGLDRGLRAAMRNLPIVNQAVDKLGRSLARVATRAGEFAGSPAFGRDLQVLGASNARIVESLGNAGVELAKGLTSVMVVAAPMAEELARMAERGAKLAEVWLANKRNSGEMAAFFDQSMVVLRGVLKFVRDIGVGLVNVFKGGAELGGEMGRSIGDMAARFREWSGSLEGQNAIKKFFDDARPVIEETGLLIRDLVKGFGGLANNGELAPLIAQLRTELLPAVMNLANSLTDPDGLASAFIDVATAFFQFSESLSFSPLVETTKAVAGLVLALSDLINTVPGLGTLIATLLTVSLVTNAAMAVVGIGAKILLGLKRAIALVRLAWLGLSIAFAASPIGVIVIGISLLIVGLVLLYKKSETVRRLMQIVFREIAQTVLDVVDTILGAIQGSFETLGRLPGKLGEPFRTAAGAIDRARQKVRNMKDDLEDLGRVKAKPGVDLAIRIQGLQGLERTHAILTDPRAGYGMQREHSRHARGGVSNPVPQIIPAAWFSGGSAAAGAWGLTGEIGPELFVPRVGPLSVLGADSPELTRFSRSGFVVPAAGTPQALANPIPDWVTARLAAEPAAAALAPSWAVAQAPAPPTSSGDAGGPYAPLPAPTINVYPQSPMDVEAAVERAYRRLEAERRDRR